MSPALELGLVGANNQGREHLVASEGVSIVAACDVSDAALEGLATTHPAIRRYRSIDGMVRGEKLDGLVVALPHHVVPEVWTDLLTAGLPLLKEKPLGRSMAESHGLIATATAAGVPVVTAIQRRLHPSYVELARLLDGQHVTALSAVLHLGFDPRSPSSSWRGERAKAGGGALLDSGYHMVDLAQALVGPLEFVHANLWTPDGPAGLSDIETDAIVTARAGPVWVRIESRAGGRPDPAKAGRFQKFERVDVATRSARFAADRTGVWVDGVRVFECEPKWRHGMVVQLERFGAMIRERQFDAPVVWDQVAAMRLIDAAYAELGAYAPIVPGRSP